MSTDRKIEEAQNLKMILQLESAVTARGINARPMGLHSEHLHMDKDGVVAHADLWSNQECSCEGGLLFFVRRTPIDAPKGWGNELDNMVRSRHSPYFPHDPRVNLCILEEQQSEIKLAVRYGYVYLRLAPERGEKWADRIADRIATLFETYATAMVPI